MNASCTWNGDGTKARLQVPFIDLAPEMRRAGRDAMLYFPREGHLNELGCAIAARVIFERVIGLNSAPQ